MRAIGKCGRGQRRLIFSSEIGRSAPEFIDLTKLKDAADKKKQQVITTYGMVTARSDGNNAVICQKLERQVVVRGVNEVAKENIRPKSQPIYSAT